ncbi:hypothetical protein PVAP13_1KG390400 [Panicum virgatum]|uniref:Uncharacterized protein n=1 Tax=Panicum virgatum TaxID=38727 RepID=A0A8T0XEW3_PANVG|nr:hypothetical protein PVAP13_1KG390400 [Panicum virgatum]
MPRDPLPWWQHTSVSFPIPPAAPSLRRPSPSPGASLPPHGLELTWDRSGSGTRAWRGCEQAGMARRGGAGWPERAEAEVRRAGGGAALGTVRSPSDCRAAPRGAPRACGRSAATSRGLSVEVALGAAPFVCLSFRPSPRGCLPRCATTLARPHQPTARDALRPHQTIKGRNPTSSPPATDDDRPSDDALRREAGSTPATCPFSTADRDARRWNSARLWPCAMARPAVDMIIQVQRTANCVAVAKQWSPVA